VTLRLAVATLALLALPEAVKAQDSLRLEFAPLRGITVHRAFQSHTLMTMTGVDSSGRPVTVSREVADLGAMSQVSMPRSNRAQVVHLQYDSLRFRARGQAGSWHEVVVPDPERRWVQARVDSHMRLLEIIGGGEHQSAGLLVHLLTGVPGLVLPVGWVHSGDRWNAQLEFPLGDIVGAEPTGLMPRTLGARAAFSVDSVRARPRDTLAYVSFTGSYLPQSLTAADGRAAQFAGALRGALIWSTGWRSVVSAATRSRVQFTVTGPGTGSGAPQGQVTLETTIRQAVVP